MGDGYHKRLPIHHIEAEVAEELISPEDDRFFGGRTQMIPKKSRKEGPVLVDSGGLIICHCHTGGVALDAKALYEDFELLNRVDVVKGLLGEPDESWRYYGSYGGGLVAIWYARKDPFPLSRIREI